MTLKYPGKVAYEAWKRASNNPIMMNWEQMTLQEQTVWNDTVKAVLNMDKDEQTIGEVAYNRYRIRYNQFGGSKTIWENLTDTYKNAWEDIAMSVLNHSTPVEEFKTAGQAAYEKYYEHDNCMNWKLAGEEHRKRWHELAKVAHDVTITNAACDGCDRD